MPARTRSELGFSLVELTAVIVIVGIIAGVAAVSMASTRDTRGAAAARQLMRDLAFARQRAVATGVRTWVDFDIPGGTWTVRAEDPDDPGRAGAAVLDDPATDGPFVQQLGAGPFVAVSLASADFDGGSAVGFDWLGRPLEPATETTPLSADGTVTFAGGQQVVVEKTTGHVTRVEP